eukprot:3926020-Rhodomonas_salina.1
MTKKSKSSDRVDAALVLLDREHARLEVSRLVPPPARHEARQEARQQEARQRERGRASERE